QAGSIEAVTSQDAPNGLGYLVVEVDLKALEPWVLHDHHARCDYCWGFSLRGFGGGGLPCFSASHSSRRRSSRFTFSSSTAEKRSLTARRRFISCLHLVDGGLEHFGRRRRLLGPEHRRLLRVPQGLHDVGVGPEHVGDLLPAPLVLVENGQEILRQRAQIVTEHADLAEIGLDGH